MVLEPNENGFTFLEILITVSVISIGYTALWTAFSASQRILAHERIYNKAIELAVDMREEILRQPFKDPDQVPRFGPETGEAYFNRYTFDDIDDYHSWSYEPPVDLVGRELPGAVGFRRSVTMIPVEPANVNIEHPKAFTHCVRAKVVISRKKQKIYELTWLMWEHEK